MRNKKKKSLEYSAWNMRRENKDLASIMARANIAKIWESNHRYPGLYSEIACTMHSAKKHCPIFSMGNEKDYCKWNETEIYQLFKENEFGENVS